MFLTKHLQVWPLCSNCRRIKAKVSGVRKFRYFTVSRKQTITAFYQTAKVQANLRVMLAYDMNRSHYTSLWLHVVKLKMDMKVLS